MAVIGDSPALKTIYAADEYLCTWSLPGLDGEWLQLPGSIDARAGRPPRGQIYGDVPLVSSSVGAHEESWEFPQTIEHPALRAALANGGSLIVLDARITYWGPGSGIVDGSAALLGDGGGFFGRTSGAADASAQPAPKVTAARFQIGALDSLLGTVPISRVANPGLPDAPKDQWTAYTNPDARLEWAADDATLDVGFDGRMRAMDAYEFRMRFSPVATLRLITPRSLHEALDAYVEPLRRIVAIATARSRALTYLTVELEGEPGRFQVFGNGITQEPFESSTRAVRDTPSALDAHDDQVSLLDLIARWRELEAEHHPLVETYGSMLHAPDQHARSRFLLLIQALEGLHGAETREEYERRSAEHQKKRQAIIERMGSVSSPDRKFIKSFLMKRPPSSLNTTLEATAKMLPVDGLAAIARTPLVVGLIESQRADSTADALRVVRNDLAHGVRGYPVWELRGVVDVLERIVRGHALRLLGCPDAAVARVFDTD